RLEVGSALYQRSDGFVWMLQRVLVGADAGTHKTSNDFWRRGDRIPMGCDPISHGIDAEIGIEEIGDVAVGRRMETEIGIVRETGDGFGALGEECLVSGSPIGRHYPDAVAIDAVLGK